MCEVFASVAIKMMLSPGGYTPPVPSLAARDVALSSIEHFSGQLVIDDGHHGRVVVVESHLEMLWAVYLVSLPNVATIVEQAVYYWVNAKGELVPKYFDFLVILHSGRRLACVNGGVKSCHRGGAKVGQSGHVLERLGGVAPRRALTTELARAMALGQQRPNFVRLISWRVEPADLHTSSFQASTLRAAAIR